MAKDRQEVLRTRYFTAATPAKNHCQMSMTQGSGGAQNHSRNAV
jgi:hypothetical protein